MKLLQNILKNKQPSNTRLASPPPEVDAVLLVKKMKRKKHNFKYGHIGARVDSSPPRYNIQHKLFSLEQWRRYHDHVWAENVHLLQLIRRIHIDGGRVDTRWNWEMPESPQYYRNRVDFCKQTELENKELYERIMSTPSRLPKKSEFDEEWRDNRKKIIARAQCKFVLFPPEPVETVEDPAFLAPSGVKRPRVYISLGIKGGTALGELCCELFTDVCPLTCLLFLDLLDGDTLGHGYVGTTIFRKVPDMYWSGGDVIYNNGFGCYMQRGRRMPIGAENYHFSHAMPGLLSMRVTCDDEVCGIFNITFKPLPQFDLKNIVFGRVVRPSNTFNCIKSLGSALNVRPVVEVRATRRKLNGQWIYGEKNTRMVTLGSSRFKNLQ